MKSTDSISVINEQLEHIANWKQAMAWENEQASAHIKNMFDRNQKNLVRMQNLAYRVEQLQVELDDR